MTSGTVSVFAPHEPSVWLRQAAAEALERLGPGGQALNALHLPILVPLHPLPIDDREDRTYDRCRTYVPVGERFWPLQYSPVPWVVLTGGLCRACTAAEVGPESIVERKDTP